MQVYSDEEYLQNVMSCQSFPRMVQSRYILSLRTFGLQTIWQIFYCFVYIDTFDYFILRTCKLLCGVSNFPLCFFPFNGIFGIILNLGIIGQNKIYVQFCSREYLEHFICKCSVYDHNLKKKRNLIQDLVYKLNVNNLYCVFLQLSLFTVSKYEII